MNQCVTDVLETYRSKPHTVKAVKYEEGMEDGWVIQIDGNGYVQKIFKSKKKADKYIKKHKEDGMEYFDPMPVFINEISEDYYESLYDEIYGYSVYVIKHKGKIYEFDEIITDNEEGLYLIVEEENPLWFPEFQYGEDFLKKYEKGNIDFIEGINVSDVKILYDAYNSLCKCVQEKVYCEDCPLYYEGCSGGQYQEDVEKFHNALDRIRDTINRK